MDYLDFPDNAKVWVYQSSRDLDEDEVGYLRIQLDDFITSWESHGKILKSTFEILHNLFVVFFVDEEGDNMCGRAQDASVNFMKQMENQLEVTFLDRMIQAYKKEDDKVQVVDLNDFKSLFAENKISENTIVYNHMVNSKSDFEKKWEVPLKDSWHKQLLETI